MIPFKLGSSPRFPYSEVQQINVDRLVPFNSPLGTTIWSLNVGLVYSKILLTHYINVIAQLPGVFCSGIITDLFNNDAGGVLSVDGQHLAIISSYGVPPYQYVLGAGVIELQLINSELTPTRFQITTIVEPIFY